MPVHASLSLAKWAVCIAAAANVAFEPCSKHAPAAATSLCQHRPTHPAALTLGLAPLLPATLPVRLVHLLHDVTRAVLHQRSAALQGVLASRHHRGVCDNMVRQQRAQQPPVCALHKEAVALEHQLDLVGARGAGGEVGSAGQGAVAA